MNGVRLYIGGQVGTIQGEREDLIGDRCFTAAHPPKPAYFGKVVSQVNAMLDSGAFTDVLKEKRLTPDTALERQLRWEERASNLWDYQFQSRALVSYDRLIDEKKINGKRVKQRWTIREADTAVSETIEAAAYLSRQRASLAPRRLTLACQGVDAFQYDECAHEVLKFAQPDDIIGLGGWCILGKCTRWMPVFWAMLYRVLPKIAHAGVKDVHIFGVLYQPALGGLLWLADQYGLQISTDSSAPVLACSFPDQKRAGCRKPYWRDNAEWWRKTLLELRDSKYYRQPPQIEATRQDSLFEYAEDKARFEEEMDCWEWALI